MNTPVLLLDEDICRRNIERMAQRANEAGIRFTPHVKTHQSVEIGEWFRQSGVDSIKVSSLKMARFFADAGWESITIAFPCNIHWADELQALAEKTDLTIVVNTRQTLEALDSELDIQLNTYIEVDTGYERSGIPWNEPEKIISIARRIRQSKQLTLYGLYSHPGQTYQADTVVEVQAMETETLHKLKRSREVLEEALSMNNLSICVGDTPGCSLSDTLDQADEISPGNFVFYDLMQHQLGACEISDIAVALRCPVVDHYPGRNHIIIHGGAVHLSKDSIIRNEQPIYGIAAHRTDNGWTIPEESSPLISISQEHGIIKASQSLLDSTTIGDTIDILPIHSCLTANLMRGYERIDGQDFIPHMESC